MFVCLFVSWVGVGAGVCRSSPFAWLIEFIFAENKFYYLHLSIFMVLGKIKKNIKVCEALIRSSHKKNIYVVLTQFKLASQGHCLTCNFYHEVHVVRWPYIRIWIYLECWLSKFKMVGDSVCQKYIIFELIWQHLVNCLCTYWDLAWWILLILLHIKYVMAKRQGI